MYADVVLGVDHGVFEDILENFKNLNGLTSDTELSADDWAEIIEEYKDAVERELGKPFPQDVNEQLYGAIAAVFGSWQNARAKTYRRLHDIPDSWGTAVTVQAMVFGNLGETSATGVAFTRNPSTGTSEIYGEFLLNAQGEDVVAGIRTPQPLTERARTEAGEENPSLEMLMPELFGELDGGVLAARDALPRHAGRRVHHRERQALDPADAIGQAHDGGRLAHRGRSRRSRRASRKPKPRCCASTPAALDQLLHPTIDPDAKKDVIAIGLPASPGAAAGEIVFTADDAEAERARGREVILVRLETSPEDIHGMHAAAGILTARGGMTSHAAVVARGMGRPCVSGAGALRIDAKAGTMQVGKRVFRKGDVITIDGGTGQVLERTRQDARSRSCRARSPR